MAVPTKKFNVVGIVIACSYVITAPIMLQDSFDPFLPGRLGRAQLADLLAPFMFAWLIFSFFKSTASNLQESDNHFMALLIGGFVYVAISPVSGLWAEASVPLADTLKRTYLVVTILFFTRIFKIENAAIIIYWVTIYILILIGVLSLCFFLAHLFTGQENIFAKMDHLFGPMRPTEKLFATYLAILSGMLFVGANHVGKPLWVVLLTIVIICAYFTNSRPGILTILFIVLSLVATFRRRNIWLALLACPTLILVATLELSAVWDVRQFVRTFEVKPVFGGISDRTLQSYLKLVAWKSWTGHPLIGVGPENFPDKWIQAGSAEILPEQFATYKPETPNSTYLYLLAETGIVGLMSWLSLILFPLSQLRFSYRDIPGNKWTVGFWFSLMTILMVDLTITNFRFLYYMIPLIGVLPTKKFNVPPQPDL